MLRAGAGVQRGDLFVPNGGILKGKALEQVSKGQRPLAAGGKNPNAVLVCAFASVV